MCRKEKNRPNFRKTITTFFSVQIVLKIFVLLKWKLSECVCFCIWNVYHHNLWPFLLCSKIINTQNTKFWITIKKMLPQIVSYVVQMFCSTVVERRRMKKSVKLKQNIRCFVSNKTHSALWQQDWNKNQIHFWGKSL